MKAERPKIREENCRRSIRLTTDDRMPPRNKYSLRLATKAAPEKQANTATDPRKAITTILQHQMSSPGLEKNNLSSPLVAFSTHKPCKEPCALQSLVYVSYLTQPFSLSYAITLS
jgi:hypothetical protein